MRQIHNFNGTLVKAEDKVALAEKLYFKKIAKQLGFSAEDIEEAMN